MFKVEYHNYLCHPETCCHNDHKSWWLMKDDELYMKFESKEEAEQKMQEIAASHRIDKSHLMRHLNECEDVVKTWPKWKLQSVRDAFGIPRHTSEANNMGDDSHIENHISPLCKMGVK